MQNRLFDNYVRAQVAFGLVLDDICWAETEEDKRKGDIQKEVAQNAVNRARAALLDAVQQEARKQLREMRSEKVWNGSARNR